MGGIPIKDLRGDYLRELRNEWTTLPFWLWYIKYRIKDGLIFLRGWVCHG